MSKQKNTDTVMKFIQDRWLSWMLEIIVLGLIAYFTISETRKTAELTRSMMKKYDAAISQYVSDKRDSFDQGVEDAADTTKAKLRSLSKGHENALGWP